MNQSDCSYDLLRSYVSLDFTRLPMKLQSLQLEKTRILQTLISFFFNLVISLSIVNELRFSNFTFAYPLKRIAKVSIIFKPANLFREKMQKL